MPAAPLNVFISYSHNEEDRSLLDKLVGHLASMHTSDPPLIRVWDDSHLLPGDPWDEEIRESLRRADIVLLLISADFNNSSYIREVEMTEAIGRHLRGECRVTSILLRPCDFEGMPYSAFEMLPKFPADQRLTAVVDRGKWQTEDFAFEVVAHRLRELVEELKNRPFTAAPPPGPPAARHEPYSWSSLFSNLPPKRKIWLLDTVNCDRRVHFEEGLKRHFEENKGLPGNLLYLITACETQKPTGIAKRLAYWFEEDCALFFRPAEDAQKDEMAFLDLQLEKKPAQTFGRCWKLIQDHILHASVDFDEFVNNPGHYLALPENARVLLSFQIAEGDFWEYDALDHISFLLERFAALPPAFQKFVFCFVLFFPGVHDARRLESDDLLLQLDSYASPAPEKTGWSGGLHLSCLPPVPHNDVLVWWNARFDHHHFSDALNRLRQDACRQEAHSDMETIEDMQYAAYVFYRDQF